MRFFKHFILGIILSVGLLACTSKKKPVSVNVLRVASPAKIKGLDPIHAHDLYSNTEVSRSYEGLVQYHYLKRPYVLIPNLAETMPEVSPDGLTYVFRLKKGVLFQDDPCFKKTEGKGRELVAEDVVYSWKRLADPREASSGWWILDGKITGLNAWREAAAKVGQADYSASVEGLKTLDRYTVQVKLVQRSSQFLYVLAMPFAYIVPQEAVEEYKKGLINHAVGTGPFRLVEFNGNSKVIWERNPTYRKEFYPSEGSPGDQEAGYLVDAGKPVPFVDRIVVQVFEESQPMWLSFLSGKLDAAGIPKDNFQQAIGTNQELSPELKAKGIVLHKTPELDITYYTFNMTDPLFGKNKLLRQAMSLAIDIEKNISLFYNGRAIAAQSPIPPGIAGYDPAFNNPNRKYDVMKAKELLKKAGFSEGKNLPPIEYATLSDSTSRQFRESDQMMFGALGIQLKISAYSWPEFTAALKNRKFQLASLAWSADYPDAENFLQLFYSKNVSPGPNDSGYSNPEYDRLYEKALTLSDGAERTALYKKMVSILVEDCPWIFGVHRVVYRLTYPWLKNYHPHEFNLGTAKYYRIDPNLKN